MESEGRETIDLSGSKVGQYHLVSLIALGGTAEVYKGYHPTLDRHVVIKLLAREFSQDEDWIRRFRQEARLLGQLDHPHILPIFDAGEHDGRPYLVTKYIASGVTLRSLLTGAPWPQDRIVFVINQVAEALAAAHASGLVHRDIKPSNVLVAPGDQCLVFDFGLAKATRKRRKDTEEGVIVGTPEYMSPEQCRGEELDERSDVYALGVMTYEMLTGRVPFSAPTSVGVLMKHLTASLPAPEAGSPLTAIQHAVIARAMDRSPARRWASARDFSRAMAIAAGQSPTSTFEVSAPTRRSTWWRHSRELPSPRRAVAVVLGAMAGLFVAALSLMWFLLASSAVELPVPQVESPPPPATPFVSGMPQENALPAPLLPSEESDAPPVETTRPTGAKARRAASLPAGSISIESNLPVTVALNGQKVGGAPGVFRDIRSGRYLVTLDAGQGVTWRRDVLVTNGSQARLAHKFEPEEVALATDPGRAPVIPVLSRPFPAESAAARTAEATRWTGYLTDGQCKILGAREDHWRCMQRCLREGAQALLFTNGKLYPLVGIDRISGDRNRKVTFEGVLDPAGRIVVAEPR